MTDEQTDTHIAINRVQLDPGKPEGFLGMTVTLFIPKDEPGPPDYFRIERPGKADTTADFHDLHALNFATNTLIKQLRTRLGEQEEQAETPIG